MGVWKSGNQSRLQKHYIDIPGCKRATQHGQNYLEKNRFHCA
tara:strand:+ start:56 stop:181 length:126 start_codon:yes stop_codon:yes gene_type:complete